jgi:hypothetical protein
VIVLLRKLWERSKSPVVQTAMVSLLFLILKNFGVLGRIGLTPESYNEITVAVIGVINAVAAYNNPDSKKEF